MLLHKFLIVGNASRISATIKTECISNCKKTTVIIVHHLHDHLHLEHLHGAKVVFMAFLPKKLKATPNRVKHAFRYPIFCCCRMVEDTKGMVPYALSLEWFHTRSFLDRHFVTKQLHSVFHLTLAISIKIVLIIISQSEDCFNCDG